MSPNTRMALVVIGCYACLVAAAVGVVLKFYAAKQEAVESVAVFDGIEPTSGQDSVIVKQYSSIAKDFFKEPFETVVFIFWPNLEGVSFSTQHDKLINAPVSAMCETIKKAGIAIEDIAFCIHNHFTPIGFTPGDIDAYQYLKHDGFKGRFGIYYTAIGRIQWMEER